MSDIPLTLACGDYDRTAALRSGEIKPEGIDLTYLPVGMPESSFRFLRHREFHVAEMSLSVTVRSVFDKNPAFVALPVFPSRIFRHSCIYVNVDSGIEAPADLIGKRVGCPGYHMSAAVWIKGMLSDRHGVPFDSVIYYTGGLEQPGRQPSADPPDHIQVHPIGPGQTLSAMLESGEIDALYTAHMPSCFARGSDRVRRLFDDPEAVEVEYFRETGIFPIMHTIAVRTDVHERWPWVAQSLVKAFERAKGLAFERLFDTSASPYMLPWLTLQAEEARRRMGRDDFWPYGLDANREVLSTFARYSFEQGITPRPAEPEEMFAPSTHRPSRI